MTTLISVLSESFGHINSSIEEICAELLRIEKSTMEMQRTKHGRNFNEETLAVVLGNERSNGLDKSETVTIQQHVKCEITVDPIIPKGSFNEGVLALVSCEEKGNSLDKSFVIDINNDYGRTNKMSIISRQIEEINGVLSDAVPVIRNPHTVTIQYDETEIMVDRIIIKASPDEEVLPTISRDKRGNGLRGSCKIMRETLRQTPHFKCLRRNAVQWYVRRKRVRRKRIVDGKGSLITQ